MTYEIAVKVAPVFTGDRFEDPAWRDRIMYRSDALLFRGRPVPLVVNHDKSRQLGEIAKIYKLDDDGPWLVGIGTMTGERPEWLKRGTPASLRCYPLFRRDVVIRERRADVIAKALLDEISVLSPGNEPGEPLARVLLLRESPVAVRDTSGRASAGGEGEVFYGGPIIRRPNIGRVLGVR